MKNESSAYDKVREHLDKLTAEHSILAKDLSQLQEKEKAYQEDVLKVGGWPVN